MNTDTKIIVKKARPLHIREIVEIWKEFEDYHAAFDPYFKRSADGHEYFAKRLHELMDSNDGFVLVAVDGQDVIGFATASIKEHPPVYENRFYGYVGSIAVKEGWKRRGAGNQMLDEIVKWFKSNGIYRVELNVRSKNVAGYNFWRKNGFKDYMHTLFLDV
jgi:ribosomal protein S18 acetylase RimI-like enzyme